MAKAKKSPKTPLIAPPEMTVLSDQAISHDPKDTYGADQLDLGKRLGPVFDVIRHRNTQTPMAIAVSGGWGTGKTSAMRWMQGRLTQWSDQTDRNGHPAIRTVWFDPWKYHERDDVWRGLIAEVIIHCIDVNEVTPQRLISATKQFGAFLGRGFLHALSSVAVEAKLAGVGVDVKGTLVRDIYDEYERTAHPERGYLNEFEQTLRRWVKDSITEEKERLVIFIDDLDRCLPDVALEVLEALKLYLDIPDLIFVLGVDREVVDAVVKKHYTDQGVTGDKSARYLDKMFEIEVSVAPSEGQVRGYLDKQIERLNEITKTDDDGLGYWDRMFEGRGDDPPEHTPKEWRATIQETIRNLCEHNPRDVKRLLNEAVFGGSAAVRGAGDDKRRTKQRRFAQGAQTYLIWHILQDRFPDSYKVRNMLRTEAGQTFFDEWSKKVRGVDPENEASRKEWSKGWATIYGESEVRSLTTDDDLARLMQIGFSRSVAAQATDIVVDLKSLRVSVGIPPARVSVIPGGVMPKVITEAVARSLRKRPDSLTPDDYASLTELRLDAAQITDVTPLAQLTKLEWLNLNGTQVADVTPLAQLTNLRTLGLDGTEVSDVEPLVQLTDLRALSLDGTEVSDVTPLAQLTKLQQLSLDGTKVGDLRLLARLTNLEVLLLGSTKVSDVTPLAQFTNLRTLSLASTQVSDVTPLSLLAKLRTLSLDDTAVSDVSPLAHLTRLQHLNLDGTQVSDKQKQALKDKIPGLMIFG
ncbi:MAG: leucine-rich repeat domain-containing protein [Phycisphaerales bacterium]|nr:leucine-rich repeat domain-containing protein [Phycisphaerales bacterium]